MNKSDKISDKTWKILISKKYTQKNRWALSRPLGKSVLDIGTGNGDVTCRLKAQTVLGMDISNSLLDIAEDMIKINGSDAILIKGNIYDIPVRKVETVICLEVLEHLKNPQKAMDEIYRVCERAYITTPKKGTMRIPEHIQDFSLDDLIKMAEKSGFKAQTFLDDTFYYIEATK